MKIALSILFALMVVWLVYVLWRLCLILRTLFQARIAIS
ncbi:unnamed protein product [Brassica rapa subsp. trilocularis]